MNDKDIKFPNSGKAFDKSGAIVDIIDPVGGMRVINEQQAGIHDGEAFSFSIYGTILAGASVIMLGRAGSKQVHFDGFSVLCAQGDMLMEFYEAPTVTTTGTAQNARRKNRAISTSATMQIFSGATVSADGTLIYASKPPLTGGGAHIESATASIAEGWVLKQNTDYIIKLTNQAASTTAYSANFGWHESQILFGD